MPLEQYNNQIFSFSPLSDELYWSTRSQLEHKIWVQLQKELRDELTEESLGYTLIEELENRCYP